MLNFVKRLFHRAEPESILQQASRRRQTLDLDEALELCGRALAETPEQKGAILQVKAVVLSEMGRLDEALHCLEKALDMSPEDDAVRQRRSAALLCKSVARAYRACDEWIRFSSPEPGFALRYPVRLQRQAAQASEIASFRDQSADIQVRQVVAATEATFPPAAPPAREGERRTREEKATVADCPAWVTESIQGESRMVSLSAWMDGGTGKSIIITGTAGLALYRGGVNSAFERVIQSFRPSGAAR